MIHIGDALLILSQMEENSIDCCVSSPPYWGLRDYGCDGQIGLEATPTEYVEKIVGVYEQVRRVLKPDGTCWVNLGDSYAHGIPGGGSVFDNGRNDGRIGYESDKARGRKKVCTMAPGLKSKDLVGIPWMVVFALRDAGWYLRSDIIWSKPNPMPESVRDRPTRAHEYIFLLAKSRKYWYDAEAIMEPLDSDPKSWGRHTKKDPGMAAQSARPIWRNGRDGTEWGNRVTRNKRSVWTIATQPFSEAHFATFPEKLAETCIKAGCPKAGIVLDPFAGSGTTGKVALHLGRRFVGIELNPEYAAMAERRIMGDLPLFAEVGGE